MAFKPYMTMPVVFFDNSFANGEPGFILTDPGDILQDGADEFAVVNVRILGHDGREDYETSNVKVYPNRAIADRRKAKSYAVPAGWNAHRASGVVVKATETGESIDGAPVDESLLLTRVVDVRLVNDIRRGREGREVKVMYEDGAEASYFVTQDCTLQDLLQAMADFIQAENQRHSDLLDVERHTELPS